MNKHIGSIRNIADLILNGHDQLDDCYIENFLPCNTATEHAKAIAEYKSWHSRIFSPGSIDKANEAHRVIWELVNTSERAAAEKGMKAGAGLIMELLNMEGAV